MQPFGHRSAVAPEHVALVGLGAAVVAAGSTVQLASDVGVNVQPFGQVSAVLKSRQAMLATVPLQDAAVPSAASAATPHTQPCRQVASVEKPVQTASNAGPAGAATQVAATLSPFAVCTHPAGHSAAPEAAGYDAKEAGHACVPAQVAACSGEKVQPFTPQVSAVVPWHVGVDKILAVLFVEASATVVAFVEASATVSVSTTVVSAGVDAAAPGVPEQVAAAKPSSWSLQALAAFATQHFAVWSAASPSV